MVTTSNKYSVILVSYSVGTTILIAGRLALAVRWLPFSTAFVVQRTRQQQHQRTLPWSYRPYYSHTIPSSPLSPYSSSSSSSSSPPFLSSSSTIVSFSSRRQNNNDKDDNNNIEDSDIDRLFASPSTPTPTWNYVPYNPNNRKNKNPNNRNNNNNSSNRINTQRRTFSTSWTVPKHINIPEKEDALEINFVRSSGAGGQNVNKLSTKVEIRMNTNSKSLSSWLPDEVRIRLKEQQSNRINKVGILTLTSQENRTQGLNKKSALDKLRSMILEAWPRPVIRKQRTGVSKAAKRRNKEFKNRRSETKQNRKRVDW